MKTYTPKAATVTRDWHLIDAKGEILGRLSTRIATLLMGKYKTDFARHLDMGDHVVVINAAEVVVTGQKATQKEYHRHSGYPGGMVVTKYSEMMDRHPERIIEHAVAGMIPQNKLHDKMLKHLHIYPGAEHPYSKQFKQS